MKRQRVHHPLHPSENESDILYEQHITLNLQRIQPITLSIRCVLLWLAASSFPSRFLRRSSFCFCRSVAVTAATAAPRMAAGILTLSTPMAAMRQPACRQMTLVNSVHDAHLYHFLPGRQ